MLNYFKTLEDGRKRKIGCETNQKNPSPWNHEASGHISKLTKARFIQNVCKCVPAVALQIAVAITGWFRLQFCWRYCRSGSTKTSVMGGVPSITPMTSWLSAAPLSSKITDRFSHKSMLHQILHTGKWLLSYVCWWPWESISNCTRASWELRCAS